jgi:ribosome maturation factor RimP
MTELENQILNIVEPIANGVGLIIEKLEYSKKGRDYYLTIYVEKEDEVTTLDDVCQVSELIGAKLDEVDLIKENYILDISTSGAEKPITDFTKFEKYVGKYMFVKFKNGYQGKNHITGTLEKVENEELIISYRDKTRTKVINVQISNISKANLAVKF